MEFFQRMFHLGVKLAKLCLDLLLSLSVIFSNFVVIFIAIAGRSFNLKHSTQHSPHLQEKLAKSLGKPCWSPGGSQAARVCFSSMLEACRGESFVSQNGGTQGGRVQSWCPNTELGLNRTQNWGEAPARGCQKIHVGVCGGFDGAPFSPERLPCLQLNKIRPKVENKQNPAEQKAR